MRILVPKDMTLSEEPPEHGRFYVMKIGSSHDPDNEMGCGISRTWMIFASDEDDAFERLKQTIKRARFNFRQWIKDNPNDSCFEIYKGNINTCTNIIEEIDKGWTYIEDIPTNRPIHISYYDDSRF